MKTVFIHTHPIQYFAPLYKHLTEDGHAVSVLYLSKIGSESYFDKEFNTEIQWDTPVLEGYSLQFVKNLSPIKNRGFWGFFNPGIFKTLKNLSPDLVVIHGWNNLSYILAIMVSRFLRIKVGLRQETPLSHELRRPKNIRNGIRKFFLKNVFLKQFSYYLSIGKQNSAFYKHYGCENSKLIHFPYSVNNKYFAQRAQELGSKRESSRKKLNFNSEKYLFISVGKLIPKKRPLDILKAFNDPKIRERSQLLFAGDGILREELEEYIMKNNLQTDVRITGFVNQSELPLYYSVADLYIMASNIGETWGLATNEAMNFGLPLILSDMVGSGSDLLQNNGWQFPCGDVPALQVCMQKFLDTPNGLKRKMSDESRSIVNNYSYEVCSQSVKLLSQ